MIINTGAKEMMSDSLQSQLKDFDFEEAKSRYVFCNVHFIVNEKIETVVGSVFSFDQTLDQIPTIELKITNEDAVGILDSWQGLKIKSFEIQMGEFKIPFEGPFKIGRIKLTNIDVDKMISVIEFHLEKEQT
jgi:hypothetical protein